MKTSPTPARYWTWTALVVVVYAAYFSTMVVRHTAVPYFDQASYLTRVHYLREAMRAARGPALLDPDLYLSGDYAMRPPLLLVPAAAVSGSATDPRLVALLWLAIRLAVLILAMIVLARFFETPRFVPVALLVILGSAYFLQVHPFLYMMDQSFACFGLLAFALVLWDLRRPSVRSAAAAAAGVLMLILVKPEGAAFVAPMLVAVSARGVVGLAKAVRPPRSLGPWARWSAVYFLLLACLIGLWRSPYGDAISAHQKLASSGYWKDDESLRRAAESAVLMVPAWLALLLATQLPRWREGLHRWWIVAYAVAVVAWWAAFNLAAPFIEDRRVAAVLPISATMMLAALCRIPGRAFKAATVAATVISVANLAIAVAGRKPRGTEPLQFLVGPVARAARPATEVGLLPLVARVRQEVERYNPPPQRVLVLTAVQDEYIEPAALNLAMRREFAGQPPTIEFRHVPWGSVDFDLVQMLKFGWFLTKQRRHAIVLQGDVWTSVHAVHNLINGPRSPLHALFERRAELPIRQPPAPIGLFSAEPLDVTFEDTVVLWRLTRRPSMADTLAAMRWIVAAFRDTPGYPNVRAQLARLERAARQAGAGPPTAEGSPPVPQR